MGSFDYLLKRSPHDNTDNTDNTQEADQPNLEPDKPDSAGIGSIVMGATFQQIIE